MNAECRFLGISLATQIRTLVIVLLAQVGQAHAEEYPSAADRLAAVAIVGELASGSPARAAQVCANTLELPYPLPTTRTYAEFATWYPLLFTPKVLKALREDYHRVARDPKKLWWNWRGAMLGDGYLWITPILEGDPPRQRFLVSTRNIPTVINDHAKLWEKRQEAIQQLHQGGLHPSLANFAEPCCDGRTPGWRFRLDRLARDAESATYRLAVWPRAGSWRDQPAWIFSGGKRRWDGGQLGTYVYEFTAQAGTATLELGDFGELDAIGQLSVHGRKQKAITEWVRELHE